MTKYKTPQVGDRVYIRGAMYFSHGMDDVEGGLATVSRVSKSMSGGEMVDFIEVKEVPGRAYNWEQSLSKEQDKLRALYGESVAHPDPDDRAEFNRWD